MDRIVLYSKKNKEIETMERLKLGRLMIVDDEVELMTILCETLKEQGYQTEGFVSGKEALERLRKEEFDLLLTDLMMPEIDGITLLKTALDIDPNLIGIIMTGQGTVKTAVEAMQTGAFDYILKPFKLNTLLPGISRAMGVRSLKKENIELRGTLAIYELTKVVSLTTDLGILANKVADAAMEQTHADEVSVMLPMEEDDNELYVAAVRGNRRGHILGQRIKVGHGIAGWVAHHHELLKLEGEITDPRFKPIYPRAEINTAVSIPMMSGGKFVGVLNLNAISRSSFTVGQIKALTITVSMAAPSIENARLFEMLQAAEAKYRNIFENAIEGIFQSSLEGRFITVNSSLARILGYDSPEELMASVTDIPRQLYVDPDQHHILMKKLEKSDKVIGLETRLYRKDVTIIWVSENIRIVRNGSGKVLHFEGSVEDITNRKIAEERQRLSNKILELLNQSGSKTNLIRDILSHLKKYIGVEAIGIRLREGEDFPYFETNGFHETFIAKEKYLCTRDEYGEIIRDCNGNVYLECICGDILCGRTDPSLPFFTEGGSFWTNSTSQLLTTTSEKERQACTRNRCNSEGYESVALIPLYSGKEIIGLLQLNDKKPNCFSLDRIKFLEGIGASIGIAIARKRAEEELKQTLEKLRRTLGGTIQAMSLTVETRDPYTAGHQKRVSSLARAIAQEMDLPHNSVENIRIAGIIHDIGKISIPAEILVKPGKISDIEMNLIRIHPQAGYDILKDVELPYPIAEIVIQHHERLDGSGYPQGLKDGNILLEAKIIAVADVVEAMASHRPYRPALGIVVALDEIEKNKGTMYDEKAVEVCIKLFREKQFSFE
jgi:PAS domain S-box-containing protein/putative nucleotidyltransferase with HDIG domain